MMRKTKTTELPLLDCYCNLHRHCLSLLYTSGKRYGRLVGHADNVLIHNAVFRVQKGGYARAVRERTRNVHAYVRGLIESDLSQAALDRLITNAVRIRYRYLERPAFFREDTGQSLKGAGQVIIIGKSAYAIDPVMAEE